MKDCQLQPKYLYLYLFFEGRQDDAEDSNGTIMKAIMTSRSKRTSGVLSNHLHNSRKLACRNQHLILLSPSQSLRTLQI